MPANETGSKRLNVSMLAPTRERCGIGDYSRLLISALRILPGIGKVNLVSLPEGMVRSGPVSALRHYLSDERLFHLLGQRLNSGDVVHLQHQYFFFGGVAPHKNHVAALLNAVRVPAVMTVHEIADGGAVGWKRALVALTNRRNFLHPSIRQIIVHTEADARKLLVLGVAESRLTVLPVAVPPASPLPDRSAARETLGVAGKRVLLMFGFLSQKKGHGIAMEALAGLSDDVVLILAGERHPDDSSNYVAMMKVRLAAKGLAERVLITGYLPEDQIPQIMAAADVALAPFSESSGSASLAHLLAYGLPIIASDIPPHRELLAQNPGSLLLTPAGDATALRQQILTLLDESARRDSLRQGAAQYCAERSYAHIALRTLAVYRKALVE